MGEIAVKEWVIRMCGEGQTAVNVRGLDLLQAKPGEDADDAWHRMKGKLGTGKHLDETIMLMPDSVSVSLGKSASSNRQGDSGVPGIVTGIKHWHQRGRNIVWQCQCSSTTKRL